MKTWAAAYLLQLPGLLCHHPGYPEYSERPRDALRCVYVCVLLMVNEEQTSRGEGKSSNLAGVSSSCYHPIWALPLSSIPTRAPVREAQPCLCLRPVQLM